MTHPAAVFNLTLSAALLSQALELYTRAMEYFSTHLKYDKNPKSREMIQNKVRCALLLDVLLSTPAGSFSKSCAAPLEGLAVAAAARWQQRRSPVSLSPTPIVLCSAAVQGVPQPRRVHQGHPGWPAASRGGAQQLSQRRSSGEAQERRRRRR